MLTVITDFNVNISAHEGEYTYWLGAQDIVEEGRWMWYNSFRPVEQFMWSIGYPNSWSSKDDCMWWDTSIHGAKDNSCTRTHYPLCQINMEKL